MSASTATLDDALQHWNAAKALIGQEAAAELFEKIVEVDELVRILDPKRNPDKAFSLLEWMYHNIEKKEEYKNRIVNMSFESALESLQQQQVSTFFSRLEVASRVDSDIRQMISKLRNLGNSMIQRIIREATIHPIGVAVRERRPDMYGIKLMQVLMLFANSDIPKVPDVVPVFIEKVLIAVTEDLRA